MTRYSLFVLKVLLNTNKPTKPSRNSVKVVSSTYLWVVSAAFSQLMRMMNVSGPRCDPCSIPAVTVSHPDITSSILTH